MRKTIGRWDRELMARSAALDHPRADRGLRTLSRLANHGTLWFAVAVALGIRGGQSRRGAIRGIAALGMASAAANAIGKPLVPRRRPAAELVDAGRWLARRPVSSSFPSGHSASAAAFAVAVGMESPLAGIALAPLAAAVGYSRIHTGVHWPSDVAAGMAIGAGTALLTQHFSPVREDAPLRSPPAAQAPGVGDGERLLFLVNATSGSEEESPEPTVREHWPKARVLHPDGELLEQLRNAVDADPPDALGVAGGDGTVAAVAAIAAERELPLVVLPAGTLNHFARDARCPEEPDEATARGSAVRIDLATVTVDDTDPRWILNTASLGVYPELVRLREKLEPRVGKWPAALIALPKVLRGADPLDLDIDGTAHRAWLVFVGANAYLPVEFTPAYRPEMASGQLDVRLVLADKRLSRLRFVLAALTGSLHSTPTYRRYTARKLNIRSAEPVELATDGEVVGTGSEFRFSDRAGALRIYQEPR